jgi:hypothetical protein
MNSFFDTVEPAYDNTVAIALEQFPPIIKQGNSYSAKQQILPIPVLKIPV